MDDATPRPETVTEPPDARGRAEVQPARELLAQHVPLALLVDLATPGGPDSREICAAEGCPEDPWWSPEPPEAA